MPGRKRQRVTLEVARQLAGITGLDLDESRLAELMPEIESLSEMVDAMEGLDLADVVPASAFTAGWEPSRER
jgi:hypothetical protein